MSTTSNTIHPSNQPTKSKLIKVQPCKLHPTTMLHPSSLPQSRVQLAATIKHQVHAPAPSPAARFKLCRAASKATLPAMLCNPLSSDSWGSCTNAGLWRNQPAKPQTAPQQTVCKQCANSMQTVRVVVVCANYGVQIYSTCHCLHKQLANSAF